MVSFNCRTKFVTNNNNSIKKGWNFSKKKSNSNLKFHGPLSNEEKERRKKNLCLYCGSSNHSLDNCPIKNKYKSPSSTTHITNPKPRPRVSDQANLKLPIFEFTLNVLKSSVKTKVLLDSGSQLNLMDVYFAKENNIPYSSETNYPEIGGIGGTQEILGETIPISRVRIYMLLFIHVFIELFYIKANEKLHVKKER